MNELLMVVTLVICGAISLVSYIVFIELRKNQRLQKVKERGREIIRSEKEMDLRDEIKRRF